MSVPKKMPAKVDFAKRVLKLATGQPEFRPNAYYDADGDCIEFLATPDPFHAERIDDLVTIYRSQETDEIMGCMVKGVSRLQKEILKRLPGFRVEIEQGRVSLTHLFQAGLWMLEETQTKTVARQYQQLIRVAEQSNTTTELAGV